MDGHLFNLEGAREITTMGASWFVSYKYHDLIDKNHNNYAKIEKTLGNRIHAYQASYGYHEYYLKNVLKMNDGNLNKNTLGLDAKEIKRMAKEILAFMGESSIKKV